MTALDLPPATRRAPLEQGRGDGVGRLARRTQRGQGRRRLLVLVLVALAVAVGVLGSLYTATMIATDQAGLVQDLVGDADLLVQDQTAYLGADAVLTDAQEAWLDEHAPTVQLDAADAAEAGPEVAGTAEDLVALLPPGSELLRYHHDGLYGYGTETVLVTDLDVTHPLAGTTLDAGDRTAPLTGDQALASAAWLQRFDVALGDVVDAPGVGPVEVVGTVTRSVSRAQPVLVVAPGRAVDRPAAVAAVRVGLPAGADAGAVAAMLRDRAEEQRAAVADHPDEWVVVPEVLLAEEAAGIEDPVTLPTIVGIVVTGFAVTVAALVAACAFAVGVRRRLRELGMLGAVGAAPHQLARLVRREGLVIGLLGAAVGAAVGVSLAVVGQPLLERLLDRDVLLRLPLVAVVPPVLVGGLGAMLAAWWPARTAARVPVVAALAGRVPAGRVPRWLPPLSGAVALAGVGLFWVAWGMDAMDDDAARALPMLGASVVATLGTAGLGLPVLAAGGRWADRLPVLPRMAIRDAARRRARSGAAVAALVPVLALPVAGAVVAFADEQDDGGVAWVEPTPSTLAAVQGPFVEGFAVPPDPLAVDAVADVLPVDGRRVDVVLLGHAETGLGVQAAWLPDPASVPGTGGDVAATEAGAADGSPSVTPLPSAGLALATPAALELLGLPPDAVGDGEVLVLPRGVTSVAPADGQEVTVTFEPFVDPRQPGGIALPMGERVLRAVVREDVDAIPSAAALVTPATAAELELVEVGRPTVLGLERPPTADERTASWGVTESAGGWVESHGTGEWWDGPLGTALAMLLGGTAVLAVVSLVAGMTAALAATESDDDLRRVVALGAAPSMRRRFHGLQAWWHAAVAGVLGTGLGLAIGGVVVADSLWLAFDHRVWPLAVAWALLAPVAIGFVIAACMRPSAVGAPRRRMA